MPDAWKRRIDRAEELAARGDATGPLLRVYARLLQLQCESYTMLSSERAALTGDLSLDLAHVRASAVPMLAGIDALGPPFVVNHALRPAAGRDDAIDEALLDGWRSHAPDFFARLVLQPYAECLAHAGLRPSMRSLDDARTACPFCGGAPQLSILHGDSASDGGGRSLQCSMCATAWPFRRVLCARCGEEDEGRLAYFHAPEFDHVRVDVCESCGGYLKSIDLTRLGRAVPLVDEVASGSLDVWATERGYQKIERNLVGL